MKEGLLDTRISRKLHEGWKDKTMYFNFGVPLALTIIGIGFMAVMFGMQKLLAPNNPYARKLMPYECGEPPTGKAWINFNVRFLSYCSDLCGL